MFFDIVHDLCLFITDVECSCWSVAGGGEIRVIRLFINRMYVAGSFIEDDLAFSTHQLQHQHHEDHLSLHLPALPLYHPPQLLIIIIEQLLHQLLELHQGQLHPCIEERGEVEELGDGVPTWREE